MTTITRDTVFEVEDCCVCFIPFAMPQSLVARRRQDGGSFYCPNGHSQAYTGTENTRLRERIARMEQQMSAKDEALRLAEEARQKGERNLRRLKKRTGNGVCPCCNRTFKQLARHMASKHPNFAEGG